MLPLLLDNGGYEICTMKFAIKAKAAVLQECTEVQQPQAPPQPVTPGTLRAAVLPLLLLEAAGKTSAIKAKAAVMQDCTELQQPQAPPQPVTPITLRAAVVPLLLLDSGRHDICNQG